MTTETTAISPPTIGGQLPTIQALAAFAEQHPTLPAAYITTHEPIPEHYVAARLDVQVDGPAFEAWRIALGADPAAVVLHTTASNTWLAVDTTYDGVRVHLAGFQTPLTADQLNAPRDTTAVSA
ncbi:hypothetical protein ACQEV4_40270 [Streptomyces shenzhenensis]|uniref:hypothetical protein n=1 Tax=Streptomyces shenzhenensis TaxID=943815 RepID=UPI003D89E716